MDRFMREMHNANDGNNQDSFDYYKELFVSKWNEQTYHEGATLPRITTRLGTLFDVNDGTAVNIGGFDFMKAK